MKVASYAAALFAILTPASAAAAAAGTADKEDTRSNNLRPSERLTHQSHQDPPVQGGGGLGGASDALRSLPNQVRVDPPLDSSADRVLVAVPPPADYLIFEPTLVIDEMTDKITALGKTFAVADEDQFNIMSQADFKKYKAIVFPDTTCEYAGLPFPLDGAMASRAVWSSAVDGNVLVIGTSESQYGPIEGGPQLAANGIKFVADAVGKTGLYFSLGCYYEGSEPTLVPILDKFGEFQVNGDRFLCIEDAHIVASHPVTYSLTDESLAGAAGGECAVQEVITTYPSDFIPLVIARNTGSTTFSDGSVGTAYIIARDVSAVAPVRCGNGILEAPEQCDDGNTLNGDGCSQYCKIEVCGNGILESPEQCDDGNLLNGDGCSQYCKIEVCGDGLVGKGEQCDDGNLLNGDGCSQYCKIEVCGDGLVGKGEQCDDGNTVNGDGCSQYCKIEVCGDGLVGKGEQCDDGNTVNGDGCSQYCKIEVCGDGLVGKGEQCDDGNTVNGDGCSQYCKIEVCGDGLVGKGEQCDDGNLLNGDGCSSTCQIEATCSGRTYWFWNPTTDRLVGELRNNSVSCIAVPYNIEVRPCTPPKKLPIRITLQNATLGQIRTQNEYFAPYYLWGDTTATGDVHKNTKPLPKGTYWLNSNIDGKLEKIKFTKTC